MGYSLLPPVRGVKVERLLLKSWCVGMWDLLWLDVLGIVDPVFLIYQWLSPLTYKMAMLRDNCGLRSCVKLFRVLPDQKFSRNVMVM